MIDVQKNKGFIVALALALVALVAALVLWRMAISSANAMVEECTGRIDSYESIVRRHQGEPGKKLVDLYQQKLQEAKQAAGTMRTAVAVEPMFMTNATTFKRQVTETVKEMLQLFDTNSIALPRELGFGPIYEGNEMPSDEALPRCVSQYLIIRDVTAVLFSNRVVKIDVIDRNPPGDIVGVDTAAKSGDDEERLPPQKEEYDAVPVNFSFVTSPAKFYAILADIRNKGQFYRIRKIRTSEEVTPTGDGKYPSNYREDLRVEMTVERIVLSKEAPKEAPKDESGDGQK